jgi:hypothetical protein
MPTTIRGNAKKFLSIGLGIWEDGQFAFFCDFFGQPEYQNIKWSRNWG